MKLALMEATKEGQRYPKNYKMYTVRLIKITEHFSIIKEDAFYDDVRKCCGILLALSYHHYKA
jgi:hypothetical protein